MLHQFDTSFLCVSKGIVDMTDSTYDFDLGSPITAIINLIVLQFSKARCRQKNRRFWQRPHRFLVGELRHQPGSQGRQRCSHPSPHLCPSCTSSRSKCCRGRDDYYCHSTIVLILLLIIFFYKEMNKVSFVKIKSCKRWNRRQRSNSSVKRGVLITEV